MDSKKLIKYEKLKPNFGFGLNVDLNKNSTLEVTLNPDFSQVEADVTQIDVNSAVALEYPERVKSLTLFFTTPGFDTPGLSGPSESFKKSMKESFIPSKYLSGVRKTCMCN